MTEQNPLKHRLLSLDALRGFDMIWILGAEGLFAALFILTGWSLFDGLAGQFKHSEWHGFTSYDLIFPLFIFLSGVTLGLSNKSLINQSFESRKPIYLKALKRLFVLAFLGVIYNHGWGQGMPADFESIRYASVLLRIGLAWFFCALIIWHFKSTYQYGIFIFILLGYWVFQVYIPTPQGLSGDLSINQSWNSWFDSNFLPGITYRNMSVDPEGILSTIPAICNALAGAFTGQYIANSKASVYKKTVVMFVTAVLLIIVASIWGLFLPVNKTLWTSSFTLLTIGYSLLLMVIFYYLIDIKKYHRFARFFSIIGINAILLYLLTSIFNWHYLSSSLVGGLIQALPEALQPLILVIVLVLPQWLLAQYLNNKRIYFKV